MPTAPLPNLLDVLTERGFLAQSTETADAMRARLAKPTTVYIGFDPTADSVHVGSLVPIMGLYWIQQCGHRPLALIGGATALVGDPSGKTEMRKMLTRDDIDANCRALSAQLARLLRLDASPTGAKLVNNADWLAGLGWIQLLREVGPHFSVNRMLSMDSVKGRMEGGGITFLEFNYMVMQAYDFAHLRRAEDCTVQMGGQDQWGNIVMGIELARRMDGAEVAGLTFPLVTKSDGGKFGKSEKGNVWLAAERTPPYEFYQFWRNVADSDVRKFMGFFTILPMAEVDRLCAGDINAAKETLAFEVTRLLHGQAAADQAREDSRKAFGAAQDVSGDSIPHGDLAASELDAGAGLLALLVRAKLATSNSEARRLVEGGGVRVHDRAVTDPAAKVASTDVVDGHVLLRAGKKRLFRFDVR
jgi:tyrosyl-tRNA synthetase